jgi:predicted acyltransferase
VVRSCQMPADPNSSRPPLSDDLAGEHSAPPRYLALDAYRGFIMLVLVSGGFGLAALAQLRPAFAGIADQFEHKPWEWIAFWDLIQPAFMFMVGVAMPFALANRMAKGATERQLFWHVASRSFRLILWSQILGSIDLGRMHFQMINVLAQIGLTYFLCFLIMKLKFRWQAVIAVLILAGHWALFVAFPGTEGPFLSKTTNVGAVIDTWVFGHPNSDNWVNINFLTSTVTTLFGVWTGQLLQSRRTHVEKMRIIAISAVACLAVGFAIHPWNPIIKRICTSSFTLLQHGLDSADAARFLLGGRGEGLPQVDLPAGRGGRQLHLHLFGGERFARMARPGHRRVHAAIQLARRLRSGGTGVRGAAGDVVPLLLAVSAQDSVQALVRRSE